MPVFRIAFPALSAILTRSSRKPVSLSSGATPTGGGGTTGSAAHLANLSGWPDLIVPAGFTSDSALPVALAFIGPAFSEARLLALGYAFESALPAIRLPATTPALRVLTEPRFPHSLRYSRAAQSGRDRFVAKGVGETSLIPVAPAIANAIEDAIRVRIFDLQRAVTSS